MKKTIKMHEEKLNKKKKEEKVKDGAVPAYLLDREGQSRAKVLSNMIKQKRKEKAGKWDVPLPKVKAVSEQEAFRVVRTGKTRRKAWKRMVTKGWFVGGIRLEMCGTVSCILENIYYYFEWFIA